MTIKEAILKVLDDFEGALTYLQVLDKIDEGHYIDWKNAKTPSDTIGAQLGHFIRQNDARVKRIKGSKGYEYYSTKHDIKTNMFQIMNEIKVAQAGSSPKKFSERSLHKLLSSFLNSQNSDSKTIFHEQSLIGKDDYQKWVHPDMIGIEFLRLKNRSSSALMKLVTKADLFSITSYEIKKEIKTDYDLKKYFFQAVSNSSWANYGYLVAFEINKGLMDEMERLSQSFGIGIIELKANPYESDVLFISRYRSLDFKTVDKLCEINKDFEKFMLLAESYLSANDKYVNAAKNELTEFCDTCFETDSEIEKYCRDNNIPWNDEN
ncbi:HTH domain-containing protein [Pedobacter duraquae]|uniref:HTH HARE-type domain-containing protein n=1 Tax=Pedobacter duraquae TaxID=425511 RepID=A0A4R6IBN8_9SPHI|nr:HTH domain-containing protein [Pedobacter duraquae]TDO19352.1 hypothetical protein CLV32_4592 [Pedobacter duraquae]